MKRGILVTLEGGEGTGKSTLLEGLRRNIEKAGLPVCTVREPGGTPVGEAIREILLDPDHLTLHPRTEILLYEASRAQLVEEIIRPAVEEGRLVLCDRYYDSTTAYQGGARGLDLRRVGSLNRFAVGGLVPDLTLLLDLEVGQAFRRGPHRQHPPGTQRGDRMERESREFHERVRRAYRRMARREPGRFLVLEGQRPPGDLLEEAWAAVLERWGKR
jgi:dTMP kinase